MPVPVILAPLREILFIFKIKLDLSEKRTYNVFKRKKGEKAMIKINEIKKTQETVDFLEDLKGCLRKHGVTMIHGKSHIEFNREEQCNFAQCYIMNGSSVIR